jgi:hypothetical protein
MRLTRALCLSAVAACLALATAGLAGELEEDTGVIKVYEVNRVVSDFPDVEDMSTPESAYAVFARATAKGDNSVWMRLSTPAVQANVARRPAVTLPPVPYHLRTRIIEVRVIGTTAGVIAEAHDARGSTYYDLRSLENTGGQWLNVGNDSGQNLWFLRSVFAARCPAWAGKMRRFVVRDAISGPEEHLKTYMKHVEDNAREPKEFLLDALSRHRLVIIGDISHRPLYWQFYASLVSDRAFSEQTGTVYLDLPAALQPVVDRFLAGAKADKGQVLEVLRGIEWTGWPDQSLYDFFMAVWQANAKLPAERRVRIVLVGRSYLWNGQGAGATGGDPDRITAEYVLKDLGARGSDRRSALLITNVLSAAKDIRYCAGAPMLTPARRLAEALGLHAAYTVLTHGTLRSEYPPLVGRRALGLFDETLAEVGRPAAFGIGDGPFGSDPFDAYFWHTTDSTYADGYDAYLYLGPHEKERPAAFIDDFYTQEFVDEAARRFQELYGSDWTVVSGTHARPREFEEWFKGKCGWPGLEIRKSAKAPLYRRVAEWLQAGFKGQKRREAAGIGPVDAWVYGGGWWQESLTRKAYGDALADPRKITREAQKLFQAIRQADYRTTLAVLNGPPSIRRDKAWQDFTGDAGYGVYTDYPSWVRWMCEHFKDNPITKVDLGEVHADGEGTPTVPYKLTLRDGAVLKGELPYDYTYESDSWWGREGLDWHLWTPDQLAKGKDEGDKTGAATGPVDGGGLK